MDKPIHQDGAWLYGGHSLRTGGAYLLKVTDAHDLNHEFSLTRGKFTRTITGFGLRLVLTCLLGLFGVVLLALGLVFVLLKRNTSSSPLAPPAA